MRNGDPVGPGMSPRENERQPWTTIHLNDKPFRLPTQTPAPATWDPAAAKADADQALRPGKLTAALQSSVQALALMHDAFGRLATGTPPKQVLQEVTQRLPNKLRAVGTSGPADGLEQRLAGVMDPLLRGALGSLAAGAQRQRNAEDRVAAVAWLNQAATLARKAPRALVEQTAAAIDQASRESGLGKLFLDKVAFYQVRDSLERDAGHDLASDPRLAGVSPEVLEDLAGEQRRLAARQTLDAQVLASRQRVRLAQALRSYVTNVTRGDPGPELDRAQFLATYGAAEGETRWQLWQAHRAKAPAYALVRGKSPQALKEAKASYQGDRRILERVEAEDAAERRRDPAGYGLAYAPGYRDAYEGAADPADKAALLWDAQGQAGIPESRRSPWTLEQSWDLATRWLAIEDGPGAATARVAFVEEALLTLPEEQRAAGLAELERQGLDLDTPGRLRALVTAVDRGSIGTAYAIAESGAVQIADSGMIAVDGATPLTAPQLAQDGPREDEQLPLQEPAPAPLAQPAPTPITPEAAPVEEEPPPIRTLEDIPVQEVTNEQFQDETYAALKISEDERTQPYYDSVGVLTIGTGFALLIRAGKPARYELRHDLQEAYGSYFPAYAGVVDQLQALADAMNYFSLEAKSSTAETVNAGLDAQLTAGALDSETAEEVRTLLFDPDGQLRSADDLTLATVDRASLSSIAQSMIADGLAADERAIGDSLIRAGLTILQRTKLPLPKLVEAIMPPDSFNTLALTVDQMRGLTLAFVERESVPMIKRAIEDRLWERLTAKQRAALVDIAYNYPAFFGKSNREALRLAIEADLLRKVEEGECQWTAMQDFISERRPKSAKVEGSGLEKRYNRISENFTGCAVAP